MGETAFREHKRHNEEKRGEGKHHCSCDPGCMCIHITAAFKLSDRLLLKAALQGVILEFYLNRVLKIKKSRYGWNLAPLSANFV